MTNPLPADADQLPWDFIMSIDIEQQGNLLRGKQAASNATSASIDVEYVSMDDINLAMYIHTCI
jgi:hypothetical protein